MIHKQKNAQTSLPQQPIDGVDNAADLYRQFDSELETLLSDEVCFLSDESASEQEEHASLPTNAEREEDADAYIKDDHFSIRFQGEKKQRDVGRIGTRKYSDSSQARDSVLSAYKADIRKHESLKRIARSPEAFGQSLPKDALPLSDDAQHSAQKSVSSIKDTALENINGEERSGANAKGNAVGREGALAEEVVNPLSDLDTGAALGGRRALAAELAQKTDRAKNQQTPSATAQRDVVRLGAHVDREALRALRRVERPKRDSGSSAMAGHTAVTYRKRTPKAPEENVSPQKAQKKAPRVKAQAQKATVRRSPSVRPPQAYQLGRAVDPRAAHITPIITSDYAPKNGVAAQRNDDASVASPQKREGVIAFFDREKKDTLARVDHRAHAGLGSQTFHNNNQKKSFAEIAQQARNDDGDAADFLDRGKVIFAQTQSAQSKDAQEKTPRKTPEKKSEGAPKSASEGMRSTPEHHQVSSAPMQKRAKGAKMPARMESQASNIQRKKPLKIYASTTRRKRGAIVRPVQSEPRTAVSNDTQKRREVTSRKRQEREAIKISLQQQARKKLQLDTPPRRQLPKKKDSLTPAQKPSERGGERRLIQKPKQRAEKMRHKQRPTASVAQSYPPAKERRVAPKRIAQPAVRRAQKSQESRNAQPQRRRAKNTALVTSGIVFVALAIFSFALIQRGADVYAAVKTSADRGFSRLQEAVGSAKQQDFIASQKSFQSASRELRRANASFAQINSGIVAIARYIPFLSKVASGKGAIVVGEHIARAGTALSQAGQVIRGVGNPLSGEASLLEIYEVFAQHITVAQEELTAAQEAMAMITVTDIPEEHRSQFVELKEKLPIILAALEQFQENNHIIADLLGANGPRKYLFLFQNNHEMRATGGFIGSYGRLDISGGTVKQFFIDGIFNPDGQLYEKVVPPQPIQKISAAWSLHDSNWFPHFPTSAEEAIVFYERTGGPTVDGVIAITPVVLQQILAVTGPIHLPDYETDITAENFMERLQYEVEVDYDKDENRPKKILSDLAPLLLERIFATKDSGDLRGILEVIGKMLAQKHIQLYARNAQVQEWITHAGWGGTIADVPYDYLSVINTNINGFKTDGVVDETIYHWSDIQDDGSIIDTVRIVRKHTGGHTPYEWWNKVNANYMRVFVPKGSQLLSVSGQTREFVEPPLDYEALGFQSDSRVVAEEQSMVIDDATGTRIYEQNGKTVFANWVYVSPQETVTVEYSYKLPFRVNISGGESADTYSILFQKQAGSPGSKLISQIALPQSLRHVWSYPESIGSAKWETVLTTDRFRGIVVTPTSQ